MGEATKYKFSESPMVLFSERRYWLNITYPGMSVWLSIPVQPTLSKVEDIAVNTVLQHFNAICLTIHINQTDQTTVEYEPLLAV